MPQGSSAVRPTNDLYLLPLIPIKLEFSASVYFIRKDSVTMHCPTIVKFVVLRFFFEFVNIFSIAVKYNC